MNGARGPEIPFLYRKDVSSTRKYDKYTPKPHPVSGSLLSERENTLGSKYIQFFATPSIDQVYNHNDVKLVAASKLDFLSNVIERNSKDERPIVDFFNRLMLKEDDSTEKMYLYSILYHLYLLKDDSFSQTFRKDLMEHINKWRVEQNAFFFEGKINTTESGEIWNILNQNDILDNNGIITMESEINAECIERCLAGKSKDVCAHVLFILQKAAPNTLKTKEDLIKFITNKHSILTDNTINKLALLLVKTINKNPKINFKPHFRSADETMAMHNRSQQRYFKNDYNYKYWIATFLLPTIDTKNNYSKDNLIQAIKDCKSREAKFDAQIEYDYLIRKISNMDELEFKSYLDKINQIKDTDNEEIHKTLGGLNKNKGTTQRLNEVIYFETYSSPSLCLNLSDYEPSKVVDLIRGKEKLAILSPILGKNIMVDKEAFMKYKTLLDSYVKEDIKITEFLENLKNIDPRIIISAIAPLTVSIKPKDYSAFLDFMLGKNEESKSQPAFLVDQAVLNALFPSGYSDKDKPLVFLWIQLNFQRYRPFLQSKVYFEPMAKKLKALQDSFSPEQLEVLKLPVYVSRGHGQRSLNSVCFFLTSGLPTGFHAAMCGLDIEMPRIKLIIQELKTTLNDEQVPKHSKNKLIALANHLLKECNNSESVNSLDLISDLFGEQGLINTYYARGLKIDHLEFAILNLALNVLNLNLSKIDSLSLHQPLLINAITNSFIKACQKIATSSKSDFLETLFTFSFVCIHEPSSNKLIEKFKNIIFTHLLNHLELLDESSKSPNAIKFSILNFICCRLKDQWDDDALEFEDKLNVINKMVTFLKKFPNLDKNTLFKAVTIEKLSELKRKLIDDGYINHDLNPNANELEDDFANLGIPFTVVHELKKPTLFKLIQDFLRAEVSQGSSIYACSLQLPKNNPKGYPKWDCSHNVDMSGPTFQLLELIFEKNLSAALFENQDYNVLAHRLSMIGINKETAKQLIKTTQHSSGSPVNATGHSSTVQNSYGHLHLAAGARPNHGVSSSLNVPPASLNVHRQILNGFGRLVTAGAAGGAAAGAGGAAARASSSFLASLSAPGPAVNQPPKKYYESAHQAIREVLNKLIDHASKNQLEVVTINMSTNMRNELDQLTNKTNIKSLYLPKGTTIEEYKQELTSIVLNNHEIKIFIDTRQVDKLTLHNALDIEEIGTGIIPMQPSSHQLFISNSYDVTGHDITRFLCESPTGKSKTYVNNTDRTDISIHKLDFLRQVAIAFVKGYRENRKFEIRIHYNDGLIIINLKTITNMNSNLERYLHGLIQKECLEQVFDSHTQRENKKRLLLMGCQLERLHLSCTDFDNRTKWLIQELNAKSANGNILNPNQGAGLRPYFKDNPNLSHKEKQAVDYDFFALFQHAHGTTTLVIVKRDERDPSCLKFCVLETDKENPNKKQIYNSIINAGTITWVELLPASPTNHNGNVGETAGAAAAAGGSAASVGGSVAPIHSAQSGSGSRAEGKRTLEEGENDDQPYPSKKQKYNGNVGETAGATAAAGGSVAPIHSAQSGSGSRAEGKRTLEEGENDDQQPYPSKK